MRVIARRSLTFGANVVDGQAQQFTIKQANQIQDVPDWVKGTETYKAALKDSTIAEIPDGRKDTDKLPPSLDEVLAQGYDRAEAEKIVEDEKRKYHAGEYPYKPLAKEPGVSDETVSLREEVTELKNQVNRLLAALGGADKAEAPAAAESDDAAKTDA